jgi:hypothetical protein
MPERSKQELQEFIRDLTIEDIQKLPAHKRRVIMRQKLALGAGPLRFMVGRNPLSLAARLGTALAQRAGLGGVSEELGVAEELIAEREAEAAGASRGGIPKDLAREIGKIMEDKAKEEAKRRAKRAAVDMSTRVGEKLARNWKIRSTNRELAEEEGRERTTLGAISEFFIPFTKSPDHSQDKF